MGRQHKATSAVGIPLLLSALLVSSGCLVGNQDGQVSPTSGTGVDSPFTVVAFVDTGINPYHEVFRDADAPLLSFRVPALSGIPRLELTFGDDFQSNVRTDSKVWQGVEPFSLYEISGTRILAASFPTNGTFEDGQVGQHKILDDFGHGTAVAGRLLQANPESYLVMVEAGTGNTAGAIQWLATQNWIDVISLSWGTIANLPTHPLRMEVVKAIHNASQTKLVVVGTGNEPTVAWTEIWGGEPWAILAGGVNEAMNGEEHEASKSPDFVADYYRQDFPRHDSVSEHRWDAGTSFSTPYVAGTLSKIILTLREALGDPGPRPPGVAAQNETLHFTLWDAQEALNRTAEYWTATDWNPGDIPSPTEDPEAFQRYVEYVGIPIAPEAGPIGPWVQMGWGAVVNGTADLAAQALLSGTLPEKPAAAVEYMQKRQEIREAFWRAACPECYE